MSEQPPQFDPNQQPLPVPPEQLPSLPDLVALSTPEQITELMGIGMSQAAADEFRSLLQREKDPNAMDKTLTFVQRLALQEVVRGIDEGTVSVIPSPGSEDVPVAAAPPPTTPAKTPATPPLNPPVPHNLYPATPKPQPTPPVPAAVAPIQEHSPATNPIKGDEPIELRIASLNNSPGLSKLTRAERRLVNKQMKNGQLVNLARPRGQKVVIFDGNGNIINDVQHSAYNHIGNDGEESKSMADYYNAGKHLTSKSIPLLTKAQAIMLDAEKRKANLPTYSRFTPLRQQLIDLRTYGISPVRGTAGAADAYDEIPDMLNHAQSRRTLRLINDANDALEDVAVSDKDKTEIMAMLDKITTMDLKKPFERLAARRRLRQWLDELSPDLGDESESTDSGPKSTVA